MRALGLPLVLLASCSLTPIPDLSSNWQDPCEGSTRVCELEFTLRAGNERTVELRGDFRDGGWDRGEPMTREPDGGVWSARVSVNWGVPVQYKFFVDGMQWLTDPENPNVVNDGKGHDNSLIDDVTCATWTCAPTGR